MSPPSRGRQPSPGTGPMAAIVLAVVVAAGPIAGCGSTDRGEVLDDLASDTIVSTYTELAATTSDLAEATEALCAHPDQAGLEVGLDRLAEVRAVWSRSEPMWVGPVMERRSWAVIDWPIAPAEIEDLIADPDVELDAHYLGTRIGADQRGLGAVEYLLAADDPATVVAGLGDERRCSYLTGITEVIADEAALIAADWTTGEDAGGDGGGTGDGGGSGGGQATGEDGAGGGTERPYVETFADPAGDGLDSVINDTLFLLEAMTDAELGRALGQMDSTADPDAIVEGPAGLGTTDLAEHLVGIRALLVGTRGEAGPPGLGPLLGDDLRDRLAGQLDAAEAAVAAVDGPLRQAVVDDPDTVGKARDAIKEVQVTVATEVVSRLGVTIGFSDADGDTGA